MSHYLGFRDGSRVCVPGEGSNRSSLDSPQRDKCKKHIFAGISDLRGEGIVKIYSKWVTIFLVIGFKAMPSLSAVSNIYSYLSC